MKRISFIFILAVLALMSRPAASRADKVILKNGNTINGIVAEETDEEVVLNVGYGTVTLPRSDIESIIRTDERSKKLMVEKWRSEHFESFPAPTPEDEELLDNYKRVKLQKEQMLKKVAKKDYLKKDIFRFRARLADLLDEQTELSKRLKAADEAKMEKRIKARKYNRIVADLNICEAARKDTADDIEAAEAELGDINKEITDCLDNFLSFEELFEQREAGLAAGDAEPERRSFYRNMAERLKWLEKGIKHRQVSYEEFGRSIKVHTTLNNRVETVMVVDTGATQVFIPHTVAVRLGIDYEKDGHDIVATMADGRQIKAKAILLDSVKVGEAETRNVEALVFKGEPDAKVEGLLGMSFLRNFSFKIDADHKKLTLSSFEK